MKKVLIGILAGLILGGGVTWLILRPYGVDHDDEKPAGAGITVGHAVAPKQAEAMGLKFAAPETVKLAPEVQGYGRVLDPAPLVAVLAEVETARVAATASEKEFARVKKLHAENANASTQALETADAAMQRDRAQLRAAQAHLLVGWGKAFARQVDLPALTRAVTTGEAALVRIDLLSGDAPAQPPTVARVGPLASAGELQEVAVLGNAPSADPQAQGAGYLALWRTNPLPPGTALRAVLTTGGEPKDVLMLPRSAFVRHQGAVFIYVQTKGGGYTRRLVTIGSELPAGLVVAEGVAAGDKVVVTGAQQLLAIELLGSSSGGGGGD
jgi:hypothetical protein